MFKRTMGQMSMRIMGQMSKRTMDKMHVRTVVMTKEFTVFLVIMTHENKINFDFGSLSANVLVHG